MLFEGLMKLFKKILALLLTVVVTMSIGCGMNNSEISRNVIYKDRDEVEAYQSEGNLFSYLCLKLQYCAFTASQKVLSCSTISIDGLQLMIKSSS